MDDEEGGQEGAARAGAAATFGQTVKAVLWAFFGVRKGRDYERDAARLNPVHVVIVGVAAAALFVLVLVFIVHQVVS